VTSGSVAVAVPGWCCWILWTSSRCQVAVYLAAQLVQTGVQVLESLEGLVVQARHAAVLEVQKQKRVQVVSQAFGQPSGCRILRVGRLAVARTLRDSGGGGRSSVVACKGFGIHPSCTYKLAQELSRLCSSHACGFASCGAYVVVGNCAHCALCRCRHYLQCS
jgi:hypothetical protein